MLRIMSPTLHSGAGSLPMTAKRISKTRTYNNEGISTRKNVKKNERNRTWKLRAIAAKTFFLSMMMIGITYAKNTVTNILMKNWKIGAPLITMALIQNLMPPLAWIISALLKAKP